MIRGVPRDHSLTRKADSSSSWRPLSWKEERPLVPTGKPGPCPPNPPTPPLACWEQLHCFFSAREVWGGEKGKKTGSGPPSTVGARPEPGRSDDGKPQAKKNSGVAPIRQRRGPRQWRQPLSIEKPPPVSARVAHCGSLLFFWTSFIERALLLSHCASGYIKVPRTEVRDKLTFKGVWDRRVAGQRHMAVKECILVPRPNVFSPTRVCMEH